MKDAEITDREYAAITNAVRRVGGGELLRAELLTWAQAVKLEGNAIERDLLTLLVAGKANPHLHNGELAFTHAERPVVVVTGCATSPRCILDEGHDGEHVYDVGGAA